MCFLVKEGEECSEVEEDDVGAECVCVCVCVTRAVRG